MKPLFKIPSKEEEGLKLLESRIIEELIPNLKKIGFSSKFQKLEGMHKVKVLSIKKGKKEINILPWIRPLSITQKDLVKSLADYPRLNVYTTAISLEEDDKIKFMYSYVAKHELYFLVMLPKLNGKNLYWLGKYQDIPRHYWKLTFRKKDKTLDRIHFPEYQFFEFRELDQLKLKLESILTV